MPRRRPATIASTTLWLVVWLGAIFVAVRMLGEVARAGEVVPALILAVWIAGALYACYRVGRRLAAGGRPRPAPRRAPSTRHALRDDMPEKR